MQASIRRAASPIASQPLHMVYPRLYIRIHDTV